MTENEDKLGKFKRNNYFTGKLMTVSDFTNEQNYFNNKLDIIKKAVLGSGCVYGLNLSQIEHSEKGDWVASLTPGVALAPNGREIIVDTDNITVDTDRLIDFDKDPIKFLKDETQSGKLALFLQPVEDLDPQMVPRLSTASTCKENCESPYWIENFKAYFDIIEIGEDSSSTIDYSTTHINKYANDFYDDTLKETCFGCIGEPRVLLAVLKQESSRKLVVDEDRTKKSRKVVYNNSLTYRLLAEHLRKSNDVGGVNSVNGLSGIIRLDSTTLDFKTTQDDEHIPQNVLMVEPKPSSLQILTGTVHLKYKKTPAVQTFGPVRFDMGTITIPPAIILTKTNETRDIADYSQHYLGDSLVVNFAPINVHPNQFDIRLWIKTPPTSNDNDLNLRYYLLATTTQIDHLEVKEISGARLITIPPRLVTFNDKSGVRVLIEDKPHPNHPAHHTFDVISTYLSSKIPTKAEKKRDELVYEGQVMASDQNSPSNPSKIRTKPGDVLKITYASQDSGSISSEIKVKPQIKITNNSVRAHDGLLTVTLIDISKNNTAANPIGLLTVGGLSPIRAIFRTTRPGEFSYEISITSLGLEKFHTDPAFKGKTPIKILYHYLIDRMPEQVFDEILSTVPGFTINGQTSDVPLSVNRDTKLQILIVDAMLPVGKDVYLNVEILSDNGQSSRYTIPIGKADGNHRVERTMKITELFPSSGSLTYSTIFLGTPSSSTSVVSTIDLRGEPVYTPGGSDILSPGRRVPIPPRIPPHRRVPIPPRIPPQPKITIKLYYRYEIDSREKEIGFTLVPQ